MDKIALEIKKLDTCPYIDDYAQVKVTESGNITKIQYMSKRNDRATIRVLPGMNEYIDLSTGEIKPITHHETRATQLNSLRRTFSNIQDTINSNITSTDNVKWITLTYAQHMTDTEKLYKDFESFNKRFKRFCAKKGYGNTEYIVIMEPHGSGSWHAHLLYIFTDLIKVPYIDNNTEFAPIWGNGFTKTKNLNDVDNVGVYLTAYLGDMDLKECHENNMSIGEMEVKEVEIEEDGKKQSKFFIKGARLPLYPAKFNMMRCSKGIKKANSYMTENIEAIKKASAGTLTFEKTVALLDKEANFNSTINTKYYNKIRK